MKFKPKARNQAWNFIISSNSVVRFIAKYLDFQTKKPLNIVYCLKYKSRECRIILQSIDKNEAREFARAQA